MSNNEFDKSKYVYELNITNFRNGKGNDVEVIHPDLDNNKCGIMLFYHHWCPHCQMMVPTWNKLGNKLKGKVFVCAVHGSNEKSNNNLVFDQLQIHGVPDIRFLSSDHIIDNSMYEGLRSLEDLIKFVKKNDKSVSKKVGNKVTLGVSKKVGNKVTLSKKKSVSKKVGSKVTMGVSKKGVKKV